MLNQIKRERNSFHTPPLETDRGTQQSGQIMSQVDMLIHSFTKEKGFFASSENEPEFKGTDHYAFFSAFFLSIRELCH